MKIHQKLIGFVLFVIFILFWMIIFYKNNNFESFKNKKNKKKNKKKNNKKNNKKDNKKTVATDQNTNTTTQNLQTQGLPTVSDQCDIKVDEWNGSPEEIAKAKEGLSQKQMCQVQSILKDAVRKNVMEALSAQNPLMTGPPGPIGPPGPSGTKLMASGKLMNQRSSTSKVPKVATRTAGTNAMSSFIYMDSIVPFASYQDWQYNDQNQITNRYDGTCLTYRNGQNELYMDKCDPQNQKMKWWWDKNNRLISLDTSLNKKGKIKCMSVSKPKTISSTASIPDCKGKQCRNKGNVMYLNIKDCNPNIVESNEIFGFQ
jgi:cytoskeletal protein RodZ